MDLPFVHIRSLYHLGTLNLTGQQMEATYTPDHWDYECGLLSVSLDPGAWSSYVGHGATTYEIKSSNGNDLKLLDVDLALKHFAPKIASCSLRDNLLTKMGSNFQGTRWLYHALRIVYPTISGNAQRGVNDWVLQTCLAFLAAKDSELHGIWFSDTLGGSMRTERGGIFQHILAEVLASPAALPTPALAPAAKWMRSTILV